MLSLAAAALLLGGTSAALPPAADVLSAVTSASLYWDSLPSSQPTASTSDCGWERGAYYSGHVELMHTTPNATHRAALLAFGNAWGALHNWSCAGTLGSANDIACGQGFAGLYDAAPQDYKLALAVTLDRAVAQWARQADNWGWVDLLFMGLPSMLLYGNRTQDARLHDSGLAQYLSLSSGGANASSQPGLWDPASNLYWRDATYIAKRNSDGTKVFWGRGNGWAAASLALAHRALPPTDPARAEIGARLAAMAGALRPLQQADGLWRANLLFPTMPGVSNPESTSTGFFTFAISYALSQGLLDAATYGPVVEKAWGGLSTVSLQASGLVGWCQPVGGGPAPATATSTSDFCVGAFLLAGSQVYKAAAAASR